MSDTGRNCWLVLAGAAALLGGLLHVAMLIGGPDWIAFFGAPEAVVESARQGTWLAPVGTVVIAGLMCLCSAYAFSGAGLLRRLPWLRTGLFFVALICVLRGLILIPLLIIYRERFVRLDTFDVVASLVWLAIGLLYAVGLARLRTPANAARATQEEPA